MMDSLSRRGSSDNPAGDAFILLKARAIYEEITP